MPLESEDTDYNRLILESIRVNVKKDDFLTILGLEVSKVRGERYIRYNQYKVFFFWRNNPYDLNIEVKTSSNLRLFNSMDLGCLEQRVGIALASNIDKFIEFKKEDKNTDSNSELFNKITWNKF